jgi:Holliday junction resolvase RusA-like endonuclease
MSITITMRLPPKELWPNRLKHWAKKAPITREYRNTAWLTMLQKFQGDPYKRAIAKLTFYWPDKRRRDVRNAEAAMKAAYDGIVDAGVIEDDDYLHLIHDATEFELDTQNPRVEITITERD